MLSITRFCGHHFAEVLVPGAVGAVIDREITSRDPGATIWGRCPQAAC
jgi:hypothetical protein